MTHEELLEFWVPAVENLFGVSHGNLHKSGEGLDNLVKLDLFLGVMEYRTYWVTLSQEDHPIPERLKSLVSKLAGPHHVSILKAYKIKKGLE